MKKIIFIILIFLFLDAASLTYAVDLPIQSLRISPIISQINLIAGQQATYAITIENLANKPLGIHANLSDFIDNSSTTTLPKLAQWIHLSQTDLLIDPGKKTIITVTINPPNNIKDGGYYAVIFFTPFISQQKDIHKPIVLSKIGALVLATKGGLNYKNISEKTLISNFHIGSSNKFPVFVDFAVTNNYFTHFSAKPFLTISPLLGQEQIISLAEKHILPSQTKTWSEKIYPNISNAIFYKASLAVSVGQGSYIYSSVQYFFIFPLKTFFVGLSAIILVLLFFIYHKRVRKAAKILFKGK